MVRDTVKDDLINIGDGYVVSVGAFYPSDDATIPRFFFNQHEFISAGHPDDLIIHFNLMYSGETEARIYFLLGENEAWSPWRAPFGSVELFGFPEKQKVEMFVSVILDQLRKYGVGMAFIIHYPDFYESNHSTLIHQVLDSAGFEVLCTDTNQHIEVEAEVEFRSLLTPQKRARLRKCRNEAGFELDREGIQTLEEAYKLIVASRSVKGYPVTMQENELRLMFMNHPDKYLLFTVRDHAKLAAVALSISVSEDVLYNFYHGDQKDYSHFSPILLAIQGSYNFCRDNGIRFLDLGKSSDQGVLNRGLYNFKREIGALDSHKRSYRMTL